MPPLAKRWLAASAATAVLLLAAPAAASTPHVTFTGTPLLQLGVASCPSTPDVANLTVRAGSTVDFVNQTGKAATLHAGSVSQAVASGGAASVTFVTAGTVSVTMVPECTLDTGTHKAMTVSVCAAPATPPPGSGPKPTPTTASPPQTVAHVVPGPTTSHRRPVAAGAPPPGRTSPSPSTSGPTSELLGIPATHTGVLNGTLILIAVAGIIFVGTIGVIQLGVERRWWVAFK